MSIAELMAEVEKRREKEKEQREERSVILEYPEAYSTISKSLGSQSATEVCRNKRNDCMVILRKRFGWTLQRIADVFDISRERVRQLTPKAIWIAEPRLNEGAIERALVKAIRTPDAWNGIKGNLLKSWMEGELGYFTAEDFSVKSVSKVDLIMRYGLGLTTKEEQRERFHHWQWGPRYRPFEEIADAISKRFVPVSTMAVYRHSVEVGHVPPETGGKGMARTYSASDHWQNWDWLYKEK